MSARPIAFVAAEASGDALGADLIEELRRRDPNIVAMGVGGARMADQGVTSAIDISSLSVLGFIEGLKAYPRVVKLADAAADAIAAANPSTVVLIDSWGFTLRVAQRLRARLPQTPLIKYIGPQVFATRPGRAKTLAETVDHLICIHAFETPYYAPFGLPCTVCGHPAIGRYKQGDRAAWRAAHGLADDDCALLILPGSRGGEVKRTAPVLMQTAKALLDENTARLNVFVLAAKPVEAQVRALVAQMCPQARVLSEGADKDDVFAGADVALAVSGTVTTEVALQGTPVVVAYRVGWLSWALMRLALKARWATLMNIAANREVAPEFLQTRATLANLRTATRALVESKEQRARQVAAQNEALIAMGRGLRPAAQIAADVVEDVISKGASAVRTKAPS